jgi:hypothetical protein
LTAAVTPRHLGQRKAGRAVPAVDVLRDLTKLVGSWAPTIKRGAVAVLGWVPVTPFGAVALAGLIAALRHSSGPGGDLIIRSVCLGGLAVFIMDVVTVLAAGLGLRFTQVSGASAAPLELQTRSPALTDFRLGLLSWAPLVHFDVSWRQPPGIDAVLRDVGFGRVEEILPRERALVDGLVRRLTVRDWFGLARVYFERSIARPLRCLPSCGQAHRFELIEQFMPGDVMGHPRGVPQGDLVETRPYASGDPLKLVIWRIFAKNRQMVVRKPELSVRPAERMLAYLVAAAGDDPAAGIARFAFEAGALGPDVIFMADGAADPARSGPEAIDQIVRSIAHRDRAALELDRFLARGESQGTSAAFLFVAPRPGPWLDRVCNSIKSHPGPFRALIGVDGIRAENDLARWRRWLFKPPDDSLASPHELRQVRDRLKGSGAEVVVLNRQTGAATSLEEHQAR